MAMEKTYETDELIVVWNPELCKHAGKCVQGLPRVFEVGRRPWVMLENGTKEEIMEVIDRCPSGALKYVVK